MLNLTSADSSAPALHALTCKWIRTWNENDPLSTCVKAEGAPSQMFTAVAAISALMRSIAKPNRAWKDLLAYRSHIPHLFCFPAKIFLCKKKRSAISGLKWRERKKTCSFDLHNFKPGKSGETFPQYLFCVSIWAIACKKWLNLEVQRAKFTVMMHIRPPCGQPSKCWIEKKKVRKFYSTVAASAQISLAAVIDCNATVSSFLNVFFFLVLSTFHLF